MFSVVVGEDFVVEVGEIPVELVVFTGEADKIPVDLVVGP